MRPNDLSVASTARRTSASFVTLPGSASACPPANSIAFATRSKASLRRPVIATRAPSCANRSAIASPIPDPPPVTIAVLFFSLIAPSQSPSPPFDQGGTGEFSRPKPLEQALDHARATLEGPGVALHLGEQDSPLDQSHDAMRHRLLDGSAEAVVEVRDLQRQVAEQAAPLAPAVGQPPLRAPKHGHDAPDRIPRPRALRRRKLLGDHVLDDRGPQGLLPREVVIQAPLGHPGLLHDVVHAGARVPLGVKQRPGGLDDPPPRLIALVSHPGHHPCPK